MQNEKWIEEIISKCSQVEFANPIENQLVEQLIKSCYDNKTISQNGLGNLFASAFDLLVSAEYYKSISHSGWLYCPKDPTRIFFHYTNCCPRHVLNNEFIFHPSNKPTSGKIGTATSRLLLLFINSIFKHKGFEEKVLKGTEPVDAIILNEKKKKVLFAEIKASPLVTLSVSSKSQKLTKEVEGEIVAVEHTTTTNSNLFSTPLDLFVPKFENGKWTENYFSIGQRKDEKDIYWAYTGILKLILEDKTFFRTYFEYWNSSIKAYYPKLNSDIYWLTNACGTPSPIPSEWPKRRVGDGFESVSDSKTSVGMDRTDDIKKGIYQVLKLGSEAKPFTKTWDYKVGIISNIDPARHFDDYLKSLKDVIWTNDESGRAKFAKDLPADKKIFNLFDGIVALTKTYSRDEWIDDLFSKL